jgi:hypothetical protein
MSYEYFHDITAIRAATPLFSTALSLSLDSEGDLVLQLAYQYGNIEGTYGKSEPDHSRPRRQMI